MRNKVETEIFKKISIRGRFAFGLICLETIIESYHLKFETLDSIIDDFWRFTNGEKLGQYEDYFITRNPRCVLSDFPAMKVTPEKMHEFGYDNISFSELEKIYELYSKLPSSIVNILIHLTYIANSNISAGCGEYSSLTFEPTLKIIEILKDYSRLKFPIPTDFMFSSFKENYGWGNSFSRKDIGYPK